MKKKKRISEAKKRINIKEMMRMAEEKREKKSFKKALIKGKNINIIAEIKEASPSKGRFRTDFDLKKIAENYEESGASGLSVLTEEDYFLGSLDNLKIIRQLVTKPILRKDFIIDGYQIYEGKAYGADAILLIASILSLEDLIYLKNIAEEIGLDVLVEVHTEEELIKALKAGSEIIGINNRNLSDFSIELKTSEDLFKLIPEGKVVVSESGIKSRKEVRFLESLGINAVLIGETLIMSDNPKDKINELLTN
ncbi:MAG: indole-3-glycerol phosphate synthase TrpC [Actinomycetia bacterium]|nr:indole-3-glycerol phosphate synthase TrpC [Actinomycetes bacterium]